MSSLRLWLVVSSFILAQVVLALPTFDNFGIYGQTSISSLVGTLTYIQAITPGHLSGEDVSTLFYVYRDTLWQYINETTIYRVNVLNETNTPEMPLQLVVDSKPAGLMEGSWSWRGSRLIYEQGVLRNNGRFYDCKSDDGSSGLFMYLLKR
ncbi:hypothetical protein FISHEDRAFT_58132 [Fistulina hepatica ATCC 64428]|nr:hypothetical protein FISHEDRAFT_58132 [Fistulina hepatica ATCC 64428]